MAEDVTGETIFGNGSDERTFALLAALSVLWSVVWASKPLGGLIRCADTRALVGSIKSGSLG